jgi:glycosyltransferase involved in cell wall biosynthesis
VHVGAQPPAAVAAILQCSDLFVLPSLFEGLPLTMPGPRRLTEALTDSAKLPLPAVLAAQRPARFEPSLR